MPGNYAQVDSILDFSTCRFSAFCSKHFITDSNINISERIVVDYLKLFKDDDYDGESIKFIDATDITDYYHKKVNEDMPLDISGLYFGDDSGVDEEQDVEEDVEIRRLRLSASGYASSSVPTSQSAISQGFFTAQNCYAFCC